MDDFVQQEILNQRFDDLFVTSRGVLIGRGALEFSGICETSSCESYSLLVTIVNKAAPAEAARPAALSEEYMVYSDFLAQVVFDMDSWLGIPVTDLVIASSTEPYELTVSSVRSRFPDLQEDTLRSFLENNEESVDLSLSFWTPYRVNLLTQSQKDEIFQGARNGWKRFYARYPNSAGMISLSRVGLSADRDQALLYYSNLFLSRGGIGALVLLRHDGRRWMIVDWNEEWAA